MRDIIVFPYRGLTTQPRERAIAMNEKNILITLLALITTASLVTGVFVLFPKLPGSLSNSIERLAVPPNDRFSDLYEKLSISRLPASIERQPAISSRLEQLNREPCYRNAISELSDALLDAGFPRESANALVSFANRCPGSDHLLAGAYNALQLVSDLKNVNGDAFYNISRMYAALARYCDAITPMETYVFLESARTH
jgi:hypothetical protein